MRLQIAATQMIAGNAGSFSSNAIALNDINEEMDIYLYFLCLILSYMGGSFVVTLITPRAQKWTPEPRYGPTFFLSGTLLLMSGVVAYLEAPSRFVFFLASAALGVQNGISSIFSANLVRCTLTGITTDIALVLGQMVHKNFESFQRGLILSIIVTNFWIGSLVSVPIVERLAFRSLLITAFTFYLLAVLCVVYLHR